MRNLGQVPFLLGVILAVSVLRSSPCSADWPPIADEVWAMKEDPAKGHVGALFLEERLSFRGNHIERVIRIRILSEPGRPAAEFSELLPEAYGLEGRTVQRDGTIIRFDKQADMEKRKVKMGAFSDERTVFVPPGVTADCVVEVKWRESSQKSYGPLPMSYGFYAEWILANRFPTLVASVDFPDSYAWPFVVVDPKGQGVEIEKTGRRYTYRNVPAMEDVPFSLDSFHSVPKVIVFWFPDVLATHGKEKPQDFWPMTARIWFKDIRNLLDLKSGTNYAALSRKIREGLPQEPVEKAFELMQRLDAQVRNDLWRTHAEAAERSKKEAGEEIDAKDIEASARRGWTSADGMLYLYYSLARDAGLEPRIALVANRNRRFFQPGIYSYLQFDDTLLVVRDPAGKEIWIDPTLRFATPGVIWAGYQGSTALEVSPGTWEVRQVNIPVQSPASNLSYYVYSVAMENDVDRFTVDGTAAGQSDWQERRRYLALEPKEQDRALRERFERGVAGATIDVATVSHAHEAGRNLRWSVKGSMPQEEGRRRMMHPFPGLGGILDIPSSFPEKRALPIVMPLLRRYTAQSTVTVPAGHRILAVAPMARSNSFGSVTWSAEAAAGGTVVAKLVIEIARAGAPPESYEELKAFLGWIREAAAQTIPVEAQS